MKLHLWTLVATVALFSHVECCNAQGQRWFTTMRVVVVGCDDIDAVFKSYLQREIRSLKDVEVVEKVNEPERTLSFQCAPAQKNGNTIGYAISYFLALHPAFIKGQIERVQKRLKQLSPDERLDIELEGLKELSDKLLIYEDQNIFATSSDGLRSLATHIVNHLDTAVFESWRKTARENQK